MDKRRILILNSPPELTAAAHPLFDRKGLSVEVRPLESQTLGLIATNPYQLVLIGAPSIAPTVEELITAIRRVGSPSRNASVLLSGVLRTAPAAQNALEKGVNAILDWPADAEPTRARIAMYLDIAPRRDVRVLTKVRVDIATKTRRVICQSINLSKSGMLVQMNEGIDIGSEVELEFTLPGDLQPIAVRAAVVRKTKAPKERWTGYGLHFLDFRDHAAHKIDQFFER